MKKNKKIVEKLSLNKETISNLNHLSILSDTNDINNPVQKMCEEGSWHPMPIGGRPVPPTPGCPTNVRGEGFLCSLWPNCWGTKPLP